MGIRLPRRWVALVSAMLGICTIGSGCHSCQVCNGGVAGEIPRELTKVSMPTYVVEPPDILLIDAVRVIPLPPYRVEPLDALVIQVSNVLPDEPISDIYGVAPEGTVNLGLSYGTVRVVGMTLEEVKTAIEKHLKQLGITAPKAVVSLAQARGVQQIRGEHLVRPDGMVSLGTYGDVYLAGMTLPQAKATIEAHLSKYLLQPEISIDVFAYNSKVYYVIFDGGGYGQQIVRLPVTGNETVLDALAQVNGLEPVSSTHHIWIARPGPAGMDCCQKLPVDWCGITECGDTATNYQVLPGDRIYVKADHWVAFDNCVAKITAPFERMFGFTLLGNSAVRALQRGRGAQQFGGGF